jgi:hypothetical protein
MTQLEIIQATLKRVNLTIAENSDLADEEAAKLFILCALKLRARNYLKHLKSLEDALIAANQSFAKDMTIPTLMLAAEAKILELK